MVQEPYGFYWIYCAHTQHLLQFCMPMLAFDFNENYIDSFDNDKMK